MQIEIFTFCREVSPERGPMNLTDITHTIRTPSVPLRSPKGFIVLRASFDELDTEPHEIVVRIVDSDGRELAQPDRTFSNTLKREEGKHAYYNCRWDISNFTFHQYGHYWLDLLVDGSQSHRILLSILPPGQE